MKKLLIAIAVIAMVFCMPVTVLADDTPILSSVGDSLIYWQELALKLAAENATLKQLNVTLTQDNATLKADLADAESTMAQMQSNVSEMAAKAREAEMLRVQADADLTAALAQIKILEELVKKLSGPRFGALVGATYTAGELGVLAGVTLSLK